MPYRVVEKTVHELRVDFDLTHVIERCVICERLRLVTGRPGSLRLTNDRDSMGWPIRSICRISIRPGDRVGRVADALTHFGCRTSPTTV